MAPGFPLDYAAMPFNFRFYTGTPFAGAHL